MIKTHLEQDGTINIINSKRVNYSHINSPFYFFKIMTEVLKEYNFICCVGEPEPERSIFIFNKNMLNVEPLRTTFDSQKSAQFSVF